MDASNYMHDCLITNINDGDYILEPSAGHGLLIDRIKNYNKNCVIDAIELSKGNFENLEGNPNVNETYHADFLKCTPDPKYDKVVGVPPYRNNIDCDHIMHMYKFLKKEGMLITFTLPYWVTGFFDRQREFRDWLNNKDFDLEFVEDESYVSCPKMLLKIQK